MLEDEFPPQKHQSVTEFQQSRDSVINTSDSASNLTQILAKIDELYISCSQILERCKGEGRLKDRKTRPVTGKDSSPHHIKNVNVKLFANADAHANANAETDAGGSTIALSGLRPDELKREEWASHCSA